MNDKKQDQLLAIAVDALEDVKGQDIICFNTEAKTSAFSRTIVASGTSNRQTRALARSVADAARENGFKVIAIEGEDSGEWVLVDLGEVVVHCMQPAFRSFYNLEELWDPARLDLETVKAALPAKAEA